MTHSRLPANCAGWAACSTKPCCWPPCCWLPPRCFNRCLSGWASSLAACAIPALSVGRAVFYCDWSWRRGGQTLAMKNLENPPGPRRRLLADRRSAALRFCRAGRPADWLSGAVLSGLGPRAGPNKPASSPPCGCCCPLRLACRPGRPVSARPPGQNPVIMAPRRARRVIARS